MYRYNPPTTSSNSGGGGISSITTNTTGGGNTTTIPIVQQVNNSSNSSSSYWSTSAAAASPSSSGTANNNNRLHTQQQQVIGGGGLNIPANSVGSSSTMIISNESNLREIRDSLVPYMTAAGDNNAPSSSNYYSAANNNKNSNSPSTILSSSSSHQTFSSSGGFMESSNWASSQQLYQMLTPPPQHHQQNGFMADPTTTASSTSRKLFTRLPGDNNVSSSNNKYYRPTTTMGARREEALIQIKQSLQPYSCSSFRSGGGGNMDTLSSESSSGTTGSGNGTGGGMTTTAAAEAAAAPLHESLLLDQVVQMGFESEPAWHALKLTQFRSVPAAVDLLLRLKSSHVFRDQEASVTPPPAGAATTNPAALSRKASFDSGENGGGGGGRCESPLAAAARITTPTQGPPPPAAGPRPSSSGVSTLGTVYSIPSSSSSSAGTNRGLVVEQAPTSAAGGPKRSHITFNLQSPPAPAMDHHHHQQQQQTGAFLVRELVAPVILQADKRQVEKPVAQNAVSPTVIAINSGPIPAASTGRPTAAAGAETATTTSSRPVLSAHFDPQSVQTVRINVQPASVGIMTGGGGGGSPGGAGGHNQHHHHQQDYVMMKYQLEANTTSGHVVSIQGRGGECPPPAGTSSGAMAFQQKQQQFQNYLHQIVVGGNSPADNGGGGGNNNNQVPDDPIADMAYHQNNNAKPYGHNYQQKGGASAGGTARFPLGGGRMTTERGVEYFPTVKEEPSVGHNSSWTTGAGRPDRGGAGGGCESPTGSSASTEESVNSEAGNLNYGVGGGGGGAEPSNIPMMVRCESPLPDSVMERYRTLVQQENNNGNCNRVAAAPAAAAATNQNMTTQQTGIGGGGGAGGSWTSKPCTPQAFKFYMEQHVENVIKQHHERQTRRMQLEKEMVKAKLTTQVQCQMRKLLNNKESNYLRLKRQKMNASMFEKLKTIGVGAFGEVALVRKKDTATLFAMKTLRKSDVIQKNQAAHVKAERDILSEADNEWVVKLFYSFQDKEHLFFIMEYIPGGDMMALLIKKGIFEQQLARFYIAELVCAIQSVHRLGFIHRDIKPDNILIDRDGHIKLTDFGLCTGLRWTHDWKYYAETPKVPGHTYQDSFDQLQIRDPDSNHKVLAYRQQKPRQKSHSLVGTPNYIAPEVLTRSGHTQLCDWWSVGVILYEMVVGHPPFLANTPEETQYKVVNWRKTLHIPVEAHLSPVTAELILRLCCGVDERLGREHNAADIINHPFFHDIDWSTLRSSPAPYKPEILHAMDTSNFDPVEPRPSEYGGDEDSTIAGPAAASTAANTAGGAGGGRPSKHDHAFYEFTFRRFFDSDGHGCPTLKSRYNNHHYHHYHQPPSLNTVFEKASAAAAATDHASSVAPNSNLNSTNDLPRRRQNVLRISTDEDEEQQQHSQQSQSIRSAVKQRQRYVNYPNHHHPNLEMEEEEERDRYFNNYHNSLPPIMMMQQQQNSADVDDETSDSAVYV